MWIYIFCSFTLFLDDGLNSALKDLKSQGQCFITNPFFTPLAYLLCYFAFLELFIH